jgi:hypothetical protein
MRTLRLSLVGTVILMLLGGTFVTVVAQSDEEAGLVTPVTGTRLSVTTDTSQEEWSVEGTVGHARIFKAHEVVEWSDPRLPADKYGVMNFDMYNIGEMRETPVAGTTLLQDEGGYWTGTFTGFYDQDGLGHGMDILTGHGAYEGLFATLHGSSPDDPESSADQMAWEGLIYEGEMPPMPEPMEPLEPPTE